MKTGAGIGDRPRARYRKPGPGEPTDAELIARAQSAGADGGDAIAARNILILRHEAFIRMKVLAGVRDGVRGGVRDGVGLRRAEDLAEQCFAEGVHAFIRSIHAFDASRGYSLLTFAGISVTRAVRDAKGADSTVTRPAWHSLGESKNAHLLERWNAAGRAIRLHRRDDGGPVDPAYLTRRAWTPSHEHGVDAKIEAQERWVMAHDLLARLRIHDARAAKLVRMRFMEGMTAKDVGLAVGLSRQHVTKILLGAIAFLRGAASTDPEAAEEQRTVWGGAEGN